MRAQENQVNPNNCSTCDHKANPDGGWCYMFRDEPSAVCKRHTGHDVWASIPIRSRLLREIF